MQFLGTLHVRNYQGRSHDDDKYDRERVKNSKRIVIKVGTAVVFNNVTGQLAVSRIGGLVEQMKALKMQGKQILLISSGAVGLGRGQLKMTNEDTDGSVQGILNKQACAATGQAALLGMYTSMMGSMGMTCAQVLITQHDFVCPERYAKLTDTLERLVELDIIPIINENDVVTGGAASGSDAAFTDNDMLSALVAAGVRADAVAMMTDVDAVFDKPPSEPGASRISVYDKDQVVEIGALSVGGRGGMASKIVSAQTAAAGGVNAVVANGIDLENIYRIFNGDDIGTLFPAADMRPTKLQHWLAHAATSTSMGGSVKVTVSAAKRLAAGMTRMPLQKDEILDVCGVLDPNSPVEILDVVGNVIGRGMVSACMNSPTVDDNTIKGFSNLVKMPGFNIELAADPVADDALQ